LFDTGVSYEAIFDHIRRDGFGRNARSGATSRADGSNRTRTAIGA
jgi:hypothetical protein